MSKTRDTLPATKEDKEAALKGKLNGLGTPRLKKANPHMSLKDDPQAQGEAVWNSEIQPHLNNKSPKKVAILYAANNRQADLLISGKVAGAINGGGQAQLFEYLANQKIAGKHEGDVHILPIGTSQIGEQDSIYNHATIESMNKQLAYIAWHVANGWEVIGFQRAARDENNQIIGTEFSLGGGYSKEWLKTDQVFIAEKDGKYTLYTSPKNPRALKDEGHTILSQNQYAQRYLEMVSKEPPEKWPAFLQNAALAPNPQIAAEWAHNPPQQTAKTIPKPTEAPPTPPTKPASAAISNIAPAKKTKEAAAILKEQVEAYNKAHPEKPIQFIHGSSSAIFEFMGKKVTTKDGSRTTIPHAIIPTGTLRKEYGTYPISGELEVGVFGMHGKRKQGINYDAISGMSPNGIGTCIRYAEGFSNQFINIDKMHKNVEKLIKRMNKHTYIRNLKLLVMHITNLMLMDPQAGEKAEHYLKLLNNEFNVLKKQGGHDAKFEERFKKYTNEIADRLHGNKFSLKSDQKFIDRITHQFPIILCSTATSENFSNGEPGEKIHTGPINLSTIHIIFTHDKYVSHLQKILEEHGITHIQVTGFQPDPKVEWTAKAIDLNKELLNNLLSATTPEQFQLAIKKINDPELAHKYIKEVLKSHAEDYLNHGSLEKYHLLDWVVKNLLKNRDSTFGSIYSSYQSEYNELKAKSTAEPNYLINRADGSTEKFSRFEKLSVLSNIIECHKKHDDNWYKAEGIHPDTFNYATSIEKEKLNQYIKDFIGNNPKSQFSIFRPAYLLSALSNELKSATDLKIRENIQERIGIINENMMVAFANHLNSSLDIYDKVHYLSSLTKIFGNNELLPQLQQIARDYFTGKDLRPGDKAQLDQFLSPISPLPPSTSRIKISATEITNLSDEKIKELADKIWREDIYPRIRDSSKEKIVILHGMNSAEVMRHLDDHIFSEGNDPRKIPRIDFTKPCNNQHEANQLLANIAWHLGHGYQVIGFENERFSADNSVNDYIRKQLEILSTQSQENWPEFLQRAASAKHQHAARLIANSAPSTSKVEPEPPATEKSTEPATPAKEPSKPSDPLAGDPKAPVSEDVIINELLAEMDAKTAAASSTPATKPYADDELEKILDDLAAPAKPTVAAATPTAAAAAPAAAPVSAAPSTPHAGGKLTASTETTYKREMMVKAKDVFEIVFQTPPQPYTGWKLEERVKDDKVTHLSVADKTNKERFTIHPAEIKTTEDNVDTFKAMLECYKAANSPGKIPTITAYSEEGKKLWQQAVMEVYAKELSAGAKIEVKVAPTITPPTPKAAAPAPPIEETPTLKR